MALKNFLLEGLLNLTITGKDRYSKRQVMISMLCQIIEE